MTFYRKRNSKAKLFHWLFRILLDSKKISFIYPATHWLLLIQHESGSSVTSLELAESVCLVLRCMWMTMSVQVTGRLPRA